MEIPLPDEVRVQELPDGVRYVFPHPPRGVWDRVSGALVLLVSGSCFAAGWLYCWYFELPGSGPFLTGIGMLPLAYLLFLGVGVFFFCGVHYLSRMEVELTSKRLRVISRFWFLRVWRQRRARHVRRFVVAWHGQCNTEAARARELARLQKRKRSPWSCSYVIVEGPRVRPMHLGRLYPTAWLLALAQDMQRRWPGIVRPGRRDKEPPSVRVDNLTPLGWDERVAATGIEPPPGAYARAWRRDGTLVLSAAAAGEVWLMIAAFATVFMLFAVAWAAPPWWAVLALPLGAFLCVLGAGVLDRLCHAVRIGTDGTVHARPFLLRRTWRADGLRAVAVEFSHTSPWGARVTAAVKAVPPQGKPATIVCPRDGAARWMARCIAEVLGVPLLAGTDRLDEKVEAPSVAAARADTEELFDRIVAAAPRRMKPDKVTYSPGRGILPVLVMVAVIVAAFAVPRVVVSARINGALARIRAMGHPVSLEELQARFPTQPPPGRNAADIYGEVFDKGVEPPPRLVPLLPLAGKGDLPETGEPLPQQTREAIEEYLDLNRESLAVLHSAPVVEDCRWPLDLETHPIDPQPRHWPGLRYATRVLALEAILHAENNDPAGAAACLKSAIQLARTLDEEPLVISQLVRIACLDMVVRRALQHVVSRTDLTDAQFAELGEALKNAENPDAMAQAQAGDFCCMLESARTLWEREEENGEPVRFPGRRLFTDLFFVRACTEFTADALEVYELPVHQRVPALRRVEAELESSSSVFNFAAQMVAPTTTGPTALHMECLARCRAARAALAVERYRLAEGRLPDALNDLVPNYLDAVPTDPFLTGPLRYRVQGERYVVYSVGMNLMDDGGSSEKTQVSRWRHYHKDATFVVSKGQGAEPAEEAADQP